MSGGFEIEISAVLRVRDDEERVGHALRRLITHLRDLRISYEIVVADEGSGDNSVFVTTMLQREFPEVRLLHARAGYGFFSACEEVHGRYVLLYDVRTDAPLSTLSFALQRLREGLDVVAISGRYLVLRRARTWRAFDALIEERDSAALEKRFLRRVGGLGLEYIVTRAPRSRWQKLGQRLGIQRIVDPRI